MQRRTTFCALILLVLCAFFTVSEAKSQTVWGISGYQYNESTHKLYGYHATQLDYYAWLYYDADVEGFIFDQYSPIALDFDSERDDDGRAEAYTEVTYEPGETYYVISKHYVIAFYFFENPGGGGTGSYFNPYGFGSNEGGGFGGFFGFSPGPGGYYVEQRFFLGWTGWQLTFPGEPHIDQILPTSAPLGSSIEVNFSGTDFPLNPTINVAGTGVTVGNISFSTSTRLSVIFHIADNAATGNHAVTISAGTFTSNSVNFSVGDRTPQINNINPSSGNSGDVVPVTITGFGFGSTPIVNVSGGINVAVTSRSDQQISANFSIPSTTLPGNYQVRVTSNGVGGTGFVAGGDSSSTSNAVDFTVNALAAPRIIDYSPKSGQLGTTVEINVTGENFGLSRTLEIGGQGVTIQSYTPVSDPDHQIVATLNIAENAETGNHPIRVSAGGQTSNSVIFQVGSASPHITSITPPDGVRGTPVPVTITGRGFGTNPTVQVSGLGVNVTINGQPSDTRIEATFQISSQAETVPRVVTVTSRGTTGNGFVQTPGATQTATATFNIKGAKIKINSMDKQFAPSLERLNITYTIQPPTTTAPFARLEIFKKGDDRNPIFIDDTIPKGGASSIPYTQNGTPGWDGMANQGPDSGKFIGPEGSPYKVRISIADNSGFTNNKNDTKSFKIEMFVETAIVPTLPPAGPPRDPGNHKKEYSIIKNWRSVRTELSTDVTLKVQYLSKNGNTRVGTPMPFKVDWSFKDVDDTSDDEHIDPKGSPGDDNATVAQGGKMGGTDAMWKSVTGFIATVDSGGQSASSDVSTIGPDIGTTKISFLSSAIGGDNYKPKATIKNGAGQIVQQIEFARWSVRKNLDFTGAYQITNGTDLRNFVSESVVEDAYKGEGYTDYHFDPLLIHKVQPPNSSEYLFELLPPNPVSDPTPELPTATEVNAYNNGTTDAKAAAKRAITDKAQHWYDRNLANIEVKLRAFLISLDATSDSVVGGNLYLLKYNGKDGGVTEYYPSGIIIQEKLSTTLQPTGVTFDPDKLWKAVNPATGLPGPSQGFETSLGLHKYLFVFSNVPDQARKQKVGRHEIGHASDHVPFGPDSELNPREKDHWTAGLMHRTALTADFHADSILRLRGRKRK